MLFEVKVMVYVFVIDNSKTGRQAAANLHLKRPTQKHFHAHPKMGLCFQHGIMNDI